MPRNTYFSQTVRSEQNLYEDLIIESLKIYGQEVYYLPRTIVNQDDVLGEDVASKFDDALIIEAYIENTDGFEGTGDLYSKFGLEIRDEATFIISRRQWQKLVGFWANGSDQDKPYSGDLIYLPLSNSMFEIMEAEEEQPFYQLSNLPVYKLRCALYEANDEDFDTNIREIDELEQINSQQTYLELAITEDETFNLGEIVTQTLSTDPLIEVYGTVQKIDYVSEIVNNITVSNIGSNQDTETLFVESDTLMLVGANNSYEAEITKIGGVSDEGFLDSDQDAKNTALELEADSILDFTESNPFGDPSETY